MARALPRTKIANGQGGCVRPCIAPDGRGQSTPAPYGRKRSWRSRLARTLTESDHRHSCKRAFWRSHYTPTYSQVRAARVRARPQTRAEGHWRLPTLEIPRQSTTCVHRHLRPLADFQERSKVAIGDHGWPRPSTPCARHRVQPRAPVDFLKCPRTLQERLQGQARSCNRTVSKY